jgi:hypothetical protein
LVNSSLICGGNGRNAESSDCRAITHKAKTIIPPILPRNNPTMNAIQTGGIYNPLNSMK